MNTLINAQTKIATLLKQHPDALETIVTLSPDFKKLRNPILRRLMAGRTTIAMASKIGGCTPDDFFQALAPLGFSVTDLKADQAKNGLVQDNIMPKYLQDIDAKYIQRFDVREILNEGNDPLKAIQQKVKSIAPGHVLVIVNSFEPVPLIKLLSKQGFETYVHTIDPDQVETYFYKTLEAVSPNQKEQSQEESNPSNEAWETVLQRFENNLVRIDVRHLEMPMPMMTILENLESLAEEQALYVQHKRIPVFLLTELKERGFDYRINEVQDAEVYLLIFKKTVQI